MLFVNYQLNYQLLEHIQIYQLLAHKVRLGVGSGVGVSDAAVAGHAVVDSVS